MVKLQLDTYTADTISAHRKIREKLESELKSSKEEKQAAELKLSSYKLLGREFKVLADEFCRLWQEIDIRKRALQELSHYKKK